MCTGFPATSFPVKPMNNHLPAGKSCGRFFAVAGNLSWAVVDVGGDNLYNKR